MRETTKCNLLPVCLAGLVFFCALLAICFSSVDPVTGWGWWRPLPHNAPPAEIPSEKALAHPYTNVSVHCKTTHPECMEAVDWINKNGRFCAAHCEIDGRDRFACRVKDGLWYVLVAVGDRVITAYPSEDRAINVQNGCTPFDPNRPGGGLAFAY